MSIGPPLDCSHGNTRASDIGPSITVAKDLDKHNAGPEDGNHDKALAATTPPKGQTSEASLSKESIGLPLPAVQPMPVPCEAAAHEKSAAMSPGEMLLDSTLRLSENDKLDSSGEFDLDAWIPHSARDRTSSFRHMATTLPAPTPDAQAASPYLKQQDKASEASTSQTPSQALLTAGGVPEEMPTSVSTVAGNKESVVLPAAAGTTSSDIQDAPLVEQALPHPVAVVSQPDVTKAAVAPATLETEQKKPTLTEERALEASMSANSFTFGEGSPSLGRNSVASNSQGSPKNAAQKKEALGAAAVRAQAEKAMPTELAEILGSDDDAVSSPSTGLTKVAEERQEAGAVAKEKKAKDQEAAELAEILGLDDSNEDTLPMFPTSRASVQTTSKVNVNSFAEAKTPPSSATMPATSTPPPPGSSSSKQTAEGAQSSQKAQLAHDLGLESDDSDDEPKGSANAGSDAGSPAASPSPGSKRGNPLAGRGRGRGGLWQSDSFIGPGGLGGLSGSKGIGLAKSLALSKSSSRPGLSMLPKAKGAAKPGSGSMSLLGGPIDWSQAEGW